MSAKRPRAPGKRQALGILMIRSEIDATIDDIRTYKSRDERRRAAAMAAGMEYIDAVLAWAAATGETSPPESTR